MIQLQFNYAYFQFERYFVRYRPTGDLDVPFQLRVYHEDELIGHGHADNISVESAFMVLCDAIEKKTGEKVQGSSPDLS